MSEAAAECETVTAAGVGCGLKTVKIMLIRHGGRPLHRAASSAADWRQGAVHKRRYHMLTLRLGMSRVTWASSRVPSVLHLDRKGST